MSSSAAAYERVAWCYDEIASLYSGGSIARAKVSQLDELRPGARVLYAGVGRGRDALAAARLGADVTCVDLSRAMLRRLDAALSAAGLTARLVRADFRDLDAIAAYDAVAANFVLNVYGPAAMERALAHLASLVRPGGHLLIADFAPPGGDGPGRGVAAAYYRPLNLAGRLLGLCALHPIYDYARYFDALGFDLVRRRRFRPFGFAPPLYESLVGVRRASP